jgi:phage host-nuclease inhibitor protein Gam
MTIDADKLVAVYVKMRDEKERLTREYEAATAAITEQMGVIEQSLLDLCKTNGQDGGKTKHGTFYRTVRTRYWTGDWAAMYNFIRAHDAIELLEQRIHQTNMKQFLTDNPTTFPEGLNVDSRFALTVRRATK